MRSLCGLCLMDLRYQPAEANKIRTNKNYSPTRGENNQYIVYSDAVLALSDDIVYQVVSADNASAAATPSVYIRSGANIQGPYKKDAASFQDSASPLPPDSTELHAITLPDGQELLFYWPKKEMEAPAAPAAAEPAEEPAQADDTVKPSADAAPASDHGAPVGQHNTYVYQNGQFIKVAKEEPTVTPTAPAVPAAPAAAELKPAVSAPSPRSPEQNAFQQIQSMNAALSQNANRLHGHASSDAGLLSEMPQKPFTGTRLYQAPQRTATPKRAHNPLMEAVEQQRYAAKYEAPGAVLPQNAELRDVSNPVDAFKRALQGLWQSTDAQHQAVDVLLAQPSMHAMLSKAIAADERDVTISAMKTQLQELEAERLMTLMQLDDAKKNLAAFKTELAEQIEREQKQKFEQLKQDEQQANKALENVHALLEPLNQQCQEAAEKLNALQNPLSLAEHTLFLSPAAGKFARRKDLIDRVEKSMKAAGFEMNAGDTLAMLTAYALSDGILEMRAENESDALDAYRAFANALGCTVRESRWAYQVHVLETGDAPLFVQYTSLKHPLLTSVYTASTQDSYADDREDYLASPYGSLIVEASLDSIPQALPAFDAIPKALIVKEILKEMPLSQDTLSFVHQLRTTLKEAGRALPLCIVKTICHFIGCTQKDLPGGVAEAIDRGVCIYIVPHILTHRLPTDELKNLFAAMPRTLKALNLA